jgi:ATP-dependent RNA helicase RhlB
MEFSELDLHPDLQRGLSEAGYLTCMPVQEQVLEHAFGGQDLYVQSQTGTGKTAAFLVVVFQRLLSEPMLHGRKAIIMVPTRELAVQVEEEAKLIGKYLPFKTGSFYGGVGYTQQTKLLKENAQILVGTPGRVLDLNQSGQMNLMEIAFLILDEADRMFDMGFYPDLRKLIRAVPPADRRQTMLFSATLNSWVKNLAWEYTRNPFEIAIESETVTVEEVEQILYHVSSDKKMKLLLGILKRENPESVLIFCNTKRYAEIVAKRLRLNGFECEFIMGDLPQPKRLKIIENIKSGKLRVLAATDVAARGLDIEDLALVVNYDLPNEAENYVHRIGRTARAGKTGKAIALASEQDIYELPAIERYLGRKIPSETASQELLADDKSEGKHIHTDFYEERESRKGRPVRRDRDAARDAKREVKRDHTDMLKSRGGKKQRNTRSPSGGILPAGSARPTSASAKQPERSARHAHARGNKKHDANLSELSFEERMTYYRNKYDKSSKPEARKERGLPKESAVPRESSKGKEKPAKGKPDKVRSPPGSILPAGSAEPEKITESPAAVETKAKKGILSRFFGAFKKKPVE